MSHAHVVYCDCALTYFPEEVSCDGVAHLTDGITSDHQACERCGHEVRIGALFLVEELGVCDQYEMNSTPIRTALRLRHAKDN